MAKGFVIAAPRSGSGKTTLTLGLIAALRALGYRVAPAKTGPDYIDTAIHARVAGREAINLDPWAMSPARLAALASAHAEDADLLVVEGVMGLFDGAADGKGSTGDLAAMLGLPVILVVDAERQAQSIAPLVAGFANWRADVTVAGVILNRVASTRHEAMLVSALAQTGIPFLGAIPRQEVLVLPERHLGLVLPGEVDGFSDFVSHAAQMVANYVDLDRLSSLSALIAYPLPNPPHKGEGAGVRLGESIAPCTTLHLPPGGGGWEGGSQTVSTLPPLGQRIAIARDDAFAFLYAHWLKDWREAGAELSFFSPLADEAPAADADAVFLPGGYPELHAARLAASLDFKAGLVAARDRGALIYGECGGYMVLGDTLTDKSGQTHEMAGLLPVSTRIDRPRRVLGYRRLVHSGALPWPQRLYGHEFHYSSAKPSDAPPLFAATDALGAALPPMGGVVGRVMGSYAHVIDAA